MNRDYKLYIMDILDSILKIEEFVGDMSYKEFVEDDKTASAVVRKLEIENFKSIKQLKLDCKRINIFIGEPNTGKSNILAHRPHYPDLKLLTPLSIKFN